jgi:hypothetical protein
VDSAADRVASGSLGFLAMRKVALGVIALAVAAVAWVVIVGMVRGANPEFSRGCSSTSSVVVQETVGVLTLATLAAAALGLVAVARGQPSGRLLVMLPIGLLLAVVWWFALAVERAS